MTSDGLRLLGGCGADQILKWNSTGSYWYCAADANTISTATIGGSGLATQVAFFSASTAISGSNNLWWNDTTGSLGIGTSDPTAKLMLAGSADTEQFVIKANATQSNNQPLIQLQDSTGTPLLSLHSDNQTNVFLGYSAGISNSIGSGTGNTFIGYFAGSSNTTGDGNVAIGENALIGNTIGYNNIAIGSSALYSNESWNSGDDNIALGMMTLFNNNMGNRNIALGYRALLWNDVGSSNIALGAESLNRNGGGNSNIAIGDGALYWTNANNNSTLGYNSGYYNTTGIGNVFMGYSAGIGTYGAYSYNTAIGYEAGYTLSGGSSKNIFLGYRAGYNETGSNNLYIDNTSSPAGTAFIYGDMSSDLLTFNANVGIGKTAPTAWLDIAAATTAKPSIRVATGSEPSAPVTGDIYNSGTALFYYNGSAWKDLGLDTTNTGTIGGSGVANQVSFFSGSTALSGSNNLWWDNSQTRLGIGTSGPLTNLDVSGTTWLRGLSANSGLFVNESGNVGIGTTAPSSLVDIAYMGTAGANLDILELANTVYSGTLTNTTTSILFKQNLGDDNADAGPAISGRISVGAENVWDINTVGSRDSFMSFQTTYNGTVAEMVRITSEGYVGIGITSPLAKLDVSGTTWLRGLSANAGLFINASGNVGIGTTAPTAWLDIAAATTAKPSIRVATGAEPSAPVTGDVYNSGTSLFYYNGTAWQDLGLDTTGTGTIAGSGVANQISFFSSSTAVSGSNNLWWNNTTGSLGIGTSDPTAKLMLAGSADTEQFVIRAYSSQTPANPLIQLQSSTGTALLDLTTDSVENVFIGRLAGSSNTVGAGSSGQYNTFVGSGAGDNNTAGYQNSTLGAYSLFSNTTGINNTSIGVYTLFSNSTGNDNLSMGFRAGQYNSTGSYNVFLGSNAGFGINTTQRADSNYNVAVGNEAGYSLSANSSGNIFLGYRAGYNETGSNKLYLDNGSAPGGSAFIYGDMNLDQLTFNANVGIGKTSPTAWLDIAAATTAKPSIRVATGAEPSAPVTGDIYNDGNQLFYYNGTAWQDLGATGTGGGGLAGSGIAGQLTFFTGSTSVSGSNNLWWDSAQSRLGIGTTAPAQALDVAGDIQITSLVPKITFNETDQVAWSYEINGDQWIMKRDGSDRMVVNSAGSLIMKGDISNNEDAVVRMGAAAAGSSLVFISGNTNNAALTSAGYFGIGTTAPLAWLDVKAATASEASVRIRAGTEPSSPATGDIYNDGNQLFYYNGSAWVDLGATGTGGGGLAGSGIAGQLTFFTGSTAVSGSNNLFWDSGNSRLGLGTTAPASQLSILGTDTTNGQFRISYDASNYTKFTTDTVGNLTLNNNGTNVVKFGAANTEFYTPTTFSAAGDVSMAYDLIFTNATSSELRSYGPLSITAGETYGSSNLNLRTYNSGDIVADLTGTGRFRLNGTDSTILFDTKTATDTDFWMGVVDDAGGDDDDIFVIGKGLTNNTNNYLTIASSGWVGLGLNSSSAPSAMLDVNGGARFRGIGSSAYVGALNYSTGGYLTTATSDGRLKTNVTTIDNALDKVMQLRGVTFNWLDPTAPKRMTGMIAQEVAAVMPELVFQNPNDGYLGMFYGETTGLLVEATKELNTKLLAMESGLTMTDGNITTFEATSDSTLTKVNTLETDVANLQTEVLSIKELLAQATPQSTESSTTVATTPEGMLAEMYKIFEDLKAFVAALGLSNNGNALAVSTDLNVLGETTLSNLTVTGDISAGLMKIDTLNNVFEVAGPSCYNELLGTSNTTLCTDQTLYLQKSLAGNVDVLNGALLVEPNGNVTVKGTLLAQKVETTDVTTENVTIKAASKTVGSGTVVTGQTQAVIDNALIKTGSKVFITATSSTGGQALIVKEKLEGVSFTVALDKPIETDVAFDWWIVNVE
ncbi:MAG: hypothetical protein UU59_C0035G0007 [candidate division WWE3 bacterium GW2011_GWE1_41_27]|uniref:Peptidase S74 domain-containing protein n=2 Tax=Katanobacteria TaxID=422282 RepID=A0A0G0Y9C9_UNCKA|nr:MAG: hypothetical protein UU59_C0035G0007 [candidate division WWE3 bacterium GW2011_GWE1_41_27]